MLTRPFLSSTERHYASLIEPTRADGRTQPQYQDLVRSLEAIVWRADAATLHTTYVSDQAETILGHPLDQWREPDFKETHLHPDDRFKVLCAYRQAGQDGENHRLDYRMTAADGRELWFHECVHAIDGGNELIGVMVDITDRKAAEASLIEMTGRLISAQEEERSRIARELHDDFSQRLALLAIGLQRLGHALEWEPEAAAQVSGLYHMTQEVASDVHRLSHRLHPAKLEHLGIVPAIKGLCRELSELYGAQIHFVHRNVPNPINKESALCLFRVAQEALSNTIKHSGVKKGTLELFGSQGALHLCVSDSGTGFDAETISAKGRLGLISMQERVRAAGGTITVESRSSTGTRISVRLAA